MGTYLAVVFAVFVTTTAIASLGQRPLTGRLQGEGENLLLKPTTRKRRSPLHMIAGLFYAFIFVFLAKSIASYGMSLAEGCAYGLLMGLAMAIPPLLNQYARYALPVQLLGGQAALCLIQNLAAGVVVGWLL